MKLQNIILSLIALALATSCGTKIPADAVAVDSTVAIWPDYADVTVPCNIAPLNFRLAQPQKAIVEMRSATAELCVEATADGSFSIPANRWRHLLAVAQGRDIAVTIFTRTDNGRWQRHPAFPIHVSADSIDPVLVYRRIAPGYRMWSEMGIYQRCLESFDEKPILNNKLTNNNCMNCHSFCMQNPDKMMFHQRMMHAGTYILADGNIEKLDTKTDSTISALVYPYWHPSGRFIAFSVNDIKQDFHASADPNRIEVFDNKSDVVVYDVEHHTVASSPLLKSPDAFETFPSFSPDGKTLYFCSAKAKSMPDNYQQVRYDLCSISFDPSSGSFGTLVDTIYAASQGGHSARFPRVSPDGRWMMLTESAYGNFSIWHRDADLRLIDLTTGHIDSLSTVNSNDVESYHSWSSNSRWFAFSSRRGTGLYTRPYICHIDANGVAAKPFLLPQESAEYYDRLLTSFNIPELVQGEIDVDTYRLIDISKYGKATKVTPKP